MISFQAKILFLLFIAMATLANTQETATSQFSYEVNINYASLSIEKADLTAAETVADLNKHFKPSWIRDYISVDVLTIQDGRVEKAVSKNGTLSKEQKDIMNNADAGSVISVMVKYMPENTLVNNDMKEYNFNFTLNPDSEAKYIGGQQELNNYLDKNGIDKMATEKFEGYSLAAVKFTIDEDGEITNPQIFESSKDEKVDTFLLNTISNMPNWEPAIYDDGTKVKQEFVLTVGNHESCVINLLNIRQDLAGK